MSEDAKKDYDFDNMSAGLDTLISGYIDYAREVIVNRALPDIRDGLKPVQRRILWTLKGDKVKGKMKSARIAGNVLKYHPHGNASVYQAMVLMTDKNGSLAFPLLAGQGDFGGFYKTDPAAADRYTEAGLSEYAEEFFGEMNGVSMIPNFDATTTEPEVLPVSFPSVLVNSMSGIAVGFKSNIPSFNFNDVIDLTIEYLENGKCNTVIAPDFVSGGYYVKNNKELMKLMQTGSARLKLRGKVAIEGKELTVYEFPAGKTIQGIKKQIDDQELKGIRSTGDFDDFKSGAGLWIDCTAKNKVDEVLYALYKDTDLQCNFNADITVIRDGEPVRLGVWGIIADWCAWRREVLTKEYKLQLEGCKEAMRESRAFVEVVSNIEYRDEIRRLLDYEGTSVAEQFIIDHYDHEIVPPDLASWIVRRGANNFRDGGKYKQQYTEMKVRMDELQGYLEDIDKTIINQLKRLKSTYGSQFPRKTEITNKDFEFSSVNEVEVKDTNKCVYALKNGFLRKMKFSLGDDDSDFEFEGLACDTLVAIDNRGRVLRVYCEDLPYNNNSDMGTYLPRYFGLDETDDYKIHWIGVLDGSTKMIIYKDGNIGFLDTSEWLNVKRQVKVLETGIAPTVAHLVGAVVDEIPEMLFVTDTQGKLGFEYTSNIKRKDRTAKTRVFNLGKTCELDSYYGCSIENGMLLVNDISRYQAPKLAKIPNFEVDFKGSSEDFIMM